MNKIISLFRYFSDKRFSTIAGTLVYFLLMSIAPFTLWLTLVCGNIDVEKFLSHEFFNSVSPFLRYMKSSAESAVSGAGIIFLLTTLYSSTNFFYHLRRSGEIIYDSPRVKGGIRLRIASLCIIIGTFLLIAVIAALSFTCSWLLEKFLPFYIADIITYTSITAVAFTAALLLNIFACPYKLKIQDVVPGSLLTTALWLLCIAGFNIYTAFANPEKLYGKIAALIIFLIWCYIIMCSFVIGIIYNGSFKSKKVYKTLL